MNQGPLLVLAVGLATAAAWLGLIFAPYTQTRNVQPYAPMLERPLTVDLDPSTTPPVYPAPIGGAAARGREVYLANGCNECHTQQVRANSADIARGWGRRRTVSQDFQYDSPAVLGVNRIGPDLANIGERRPEADWHYRHLFWPKSINRDSVMPSFRHLFELKKLVGQPSEDYIPMASGGRIVAWDFNSVPDRLKAPAGYEYVLSDEAKDLVAYLQSLDRSTPLELTKPASTE